MSAETIQPGLDDQRHAKRLSLMLPVDLSTSTDEKSPAFLLDISRNGALIATESAVEIGDVVHVSFGIGRPCKVEANVVWLGDGIFGSQFDLSLPLDDLAMIKRTGLALPPPELQGQDARSMLPKFIERAKLMSGLSATEIAHKLQVSRPTLWAWETGRTSPRGSNLKRLTEFFADAGVVVPVHSISAESAPAEAGRFSDQTLVDCKRDIALKLGIPETRIKILVEF